MKEKRNFSTGNITIGAVLGAIVFILFRLKFPLFKESIVRLVLVLGRNPYNIYDPLFTMETLLLELVQLFFALFFIFAGVFIVLCITKEHNDEAWMGKAIKNILISLLAAPIAYVSLDYIGMSFYYYAERLLGNVASLLVANFSEAMIGLALSLFVVNLKQYPKGKIKFSLVGLISGWSISLLIFIVFLRLNREGNDLRILVRHSQIPLTVAGVGIAVMLVEKKANRQFEKSQYF